MASYNYIEGKKRIIDILDNPNNTESVDKIPKLTEFTFDNGYYGWVTAVFVDIRDSTAKLFANKSERKTTIAKIMRCFTSEIIEILRNDNNLRDIGIRGDCVFAIYTCSKVYEDFEIFNKIVYVNTYIDMLNKILNNKGFDSINIGIGVATSIDLVVKAGRKGADINDLIWIGEAVTYASKFSSIASKDGNSKIILSSLFFENINSHSSNMEKTQWDSNWFTKKFNSDYGFYYTGSIVMTDFNEWIKKGMPNE